mmetsp:Transcript_154237/g.269816  ORF Transcript_154237/g.269816 Transcript_154237/m.269816 type:complete len:206 (-) Transcript_154237:2-619(-)
MAEAERGRAYLIVSTILQKWGTICCHGWQGPPLDFLVFPPTSMFTGYAFQSRGTCGARRCQILYVCLHPKLALPFQGAIPGIAAHIHSQQCEIISVISITTLSGVKQHHYTKLNQGCKPGPAVGAFCACCTWMPRPLHVTLTTSLVTEWWTWLSCTLFHNTCLHRSFCNRDVDVRKSGGGGGGPFCPFFFPTFLKKFFFFSFPLF